MEPRNVIVWLLLPVLVVLAMSAGVQARELMEVPASEILEKIQAGEDVYLENVRITGEFNLSEIELETVPIARENGSLRYSGIEEELKVIQSNISIINSVFENNVDFSKTQFRKTLDFRLTSFSKISDFTSATFNDRADFRRVHFNGTANFQYVLFRGNATFRGVTFRGIANFRGADFDDIADFWDADFDDIADLRGADFSGYTNFAGATFNDSADFRRVHFNGTANFQYVPFRGNATFEGVTFSSTASFWNASFDDTANFCARFDDIADFQYVHFNGTANFQYVPFGGNATFKDATFSSTASFKGATFSSTASFFSADFYANASFVSADFYANADFGDADFYANASFSSADFYANADFRTANFSGDADFKHMDFRRDVFFDNQVYIKLIKDFRDNALFDDANNIYYQYRKRESQASLANFFMWASCGYGVRPWYAVVWGVTIIFMCALVYWLTGGIRQSKENCEDDEQDAPLCDAVYLIMVATTAGFIYFSRDCGWNLQYAIIIAGAMILIYIHRQYKLRFFCWQNQTDATYKQGRKSLLTLYFRCLEKLNLWLRGICRLENNGGKKDAPFCDAFYFTMVAVTTVGFIYLSRDCGWKLQDTRILTGAIILMSILSYILKCQLESNIGKKDVSFCDALYFSVTTFTTLGYGDWYPKDRYRILAAIEGFVGWLTLALFLVTLANVMIRP